jgi:hypothetical protein
MPIALFPELTATLRRTGIVVAPWSRLVEIETQLLRRAESAFLTRWFGTSVPERRLSLYIAIRNLDQLRDQYLLAKRSMAPPLPELNLLGPLSGIAGLLVGMAMSPTGALLIATQARRIAGALVERPWLADIIAISYRLLGIFILPALGPVLALVIGMPLLLIAGLGFVAGGNPVARAVVGLLGELAMLIEWLGRFWDQLTGPRENIRNPLLRRLLETLDRFAGLFVQVLGLAGFVLVKLAPLIPNLLAQYRALMGLIDAVVMTLTDIFSGIVDALIEPFTSGRGILGVLTDVLDRLLSLPSLVISPLTALLEDTVTELTYAWEAISLQVDAFATGFTDRLKTAFTATPLGQLVDRIKALLKLMPAFIAAFEAAQPPAEEENGEPIQVMLRSWWMEGLTGGIIGPGLGSRAADVIDAVQRLSLPPRPDITLPQIPSAPTLPDLDALLAAHPRPEIPDFAAMTSELVDIAVEAQASARVPPEIARTPASAFAQERHRLEAESPRPVLQLDDTRLRDLIYIAVGRVLPPALRVYAPDVRALFDRIDEQVYGAPEMTEEQQAALAEQLLPQEDLGDSGLLRTVVGDLRFVTARGEMPDLRAFRDLVIEAVQAQVYPAPAAAVP